MDVAPKNPLIRVFFGRQAGELANVDKPVTTLKEVFFGIDTEFKVADIDSTYINGVNQDIELIINNDACVNDLNRLKLDVESLHAPEPKKVKSVRKHDLSGSMDSYYREKEFS